MFDVEIPAEQGPRDHPPDPSLWTGRWSSEAGRDSHDPTAVVGSLTEPGSSLPGQRFSQNAPCLGPLLAWLMLLTLLAVLVDIDTSALERWYHLYPHWQCIKILFPQTITSTEFCSSLLLISSIIVLSYFLWMPSSHCRVPCPDNSSVWRPGVAGLLLSSCYVRGPGAGARGKVNASICHGEALSE